MPSPSHAADSHEIRALTGVRGIAALAVVFYHMFETWGQLLPELQPAATLIDHGHLGVSLFFILSGFILCYVYEAGASNLGWASYGRFIWIRFARIYPVHVATLLALLACSLLGPRFHLHMDGWNYPLWGLPSQLALTHIWPFLYGGRWNFPAWSISAEWFAYLAVFPLAAVLLRKSRPALVWIAAGLASLAYCLAIYRIPVAAEIIDTRPAALVDVSCSFLAGAMFFGLYRGGGSVVALCQKAATWLALALPALACFRAPWATTAIVLLLPFFLLSLTSDHSGVAKFLSWRPMLWLGKISYSIYMSHGFFVRFSRAGGLASRFGEGSFPLRLLVTSASFLLIIAAGALLFYLVELPGRNFLRRFGARGAGQSRGPAPA